MCAGMSGFGELFLIVMAAPIISIFSIIAFSYMAKFRGWLAAISALFILIFGTIINARLFAFLYIDVTSPIITWIFGTIYELFKLLDMEPPIIFAFIIYFIYLFSLICFIAALYGILGYACRKWRIKNDIPLNSVYEKDIIIIAIIFLLSSIIIKGPILYSVFFENCL